MHQIAKFIGAAIAFGFIAASILITFRFGQQFGSTSFDRWLFGGVGALSDGMKALLPLLAYAAWHNSRWFAVGIAIICWILFAAYSLFSSIGYAANLRAEQTGSRQMIHQRYLAAKLKRDRIEADYRRLAVTRPAKAITAELQAIRRHKRWKTTKGCNPKETTANLSRELCDSYFRKVGELEIAKRAEQLRDQLEAAETVLARLSAGVAEAGDPQIETLTAISGLAQDHVRLSVTILLSLIVELGSSLGLFISFSTGNSRVTSRGPVSPPLDNEPDLQYLSHSTPLDDQWLKESTIIRAESQMPLAVLYGDYAEYCRSEDRIDYMRLSDFRIWLVGTGAGVEMRGQREIVSGLFLQSEKSAQPDRLSGEDFVTSLGGATK